MLSHTRRGTMRSVRAAGLVATALVGMVAGTATPAHSWTHPINQPLVYFQPDGDRRDTDWIRGCIVETTLRKDSGGDFVELVAFSGSFKGLSSHCAHNEGYVTVVTYDGTRLNRGPAAVTSRAFGPVVDPGVGSNYYYSYARSFGPYGQAIFGAHVCATNVNALITCWDITVF